MQPTRVWYLAYGSNINAARFLRYLQGGPPEPGARDATPPLSSAWTTVPHRLMFGLESKRWNGGGVAFLDTAEAGSAASAIVRAWDITTEQFEDVCAQENRTDVGTPLDWAALAKGPVTLDHASPYRYVLPVAVDGLPIDQPAITFTSPEPIPPNPPGETYLNTIRAGLADHPDLNAEAVDAYLGLRRSD